MNSRRIALLALLFALSLACATETACAASPARGAAISSAPAPATLSAQQLRYLGLAKAGVAAAESLWRDRHLGWYDARLHDHDRYPLATIWDIVPLFESLDAIAIAQPNAANKRAVARFAAGAERYLNHGLRPLAGFSPYAGDRSANTETWFDDNGWWGLGLVIDIYCTRSYLVPLRAYTALQPLHGSAVTK